MQRKLGFGLRALVWSLCSAVVLTSINLYHTKHLRLLKLPTYSSISPFPNWSLYWTLLWLFRGTSWEILERAAFCTQTQALTEANCVKMVYLDWFAMIWLPHTQLWLLHHSWDSGCTLEILLLRHLNWITPTTNQKTVSILIKSWKRLPSTLIVTTFVIWTWLVKM